ncbi:MAG: signal recognition particle-docking protein FtsY [Deltaproteobacteria bacterium]|nr:signal recognition particle-docking protein FtsY [Deltaproteobacteria bacterium]MBW2136797.1 signal recognition particle-docking protein FtsY [Deltaproteobacteria bacterium]
MARFFRRKQKEVEDKKGLFKKLKEGLSKTRTGLTGRLDGLLFGKKEIDEDILEEIEEILFTSDLGVATTQELLDMLQEGVRKKELNDPQKLKQALKDSMRSFLEVGEKDHSSPGENEPRVVMVIGVNGVGKTTTIGKAAHMLKEQGKKVMLVAADTFRAAAIEQLDIWAERISAEVIKQAPGADPSAVVFDAISAAQSRNIDVVLIDTAGRLHTKTNLMDELRKIHRVAGKRLPGAPHEVWLVLDATTGQNAISQAQMFHETLGVTDIILTKLDGTAKGGIVVGIAHQLKIPIKYIGIGEKLDDLRPFDASEFVEAIWGR